MAKNMPFAARLHGAGGVLSVVTGYFSRKDIIVTSRQCVSDLE